MKPLFIKKNGTVSKVSGIIMNLIPSYTLAEYNALTHKPLLWVRTDEEYAQIPASDVSYGSGSVEDALDGFIVENKTVWANLTLAANSSTTVQTSDISKSGYTPIGIVGYSFDGSNGNCLSYSKLTVSSNALTYLVANNGNSSASSVNCVVQILYKKAKQ